MTIISYQPVVWPLLGLLGVWMQLKINFPGSAPSTTVTGPGSGAEQPSLAAALSSSFLLPTASRRKRKIIQDEKFLEATFPLLRPAKVTCGDWKLDAVDTNEQSLTVTSVVSHPNYNPSTSANDIAVVKVSGSFTCAQSKIWPACLPNKSVNI